MTKAVKISARQRAVTSAVAQAMPGWFRARSNGERVTLASLWRAGVLERRAWRGIEGEADAAHEYRLAKRFIAAIKGFIAAIKGAS